MITTNNKIYDEGNQREGRERAFILSVLDDLMLPKVIEEINGKASWDILNVAYQGNDKVKTVRLKTLIGQFETLKVIDSQSVDEFMTKVMGIVNQFQINGEKIKDQTIVEKIMKWQ